MPRSHRLRDAAIGLVALLALLAIVIAVPVALVRFVGWPLPTTMPTVDVIGAALRYGHVAPGTLLKTLAVVVWATWLLMTVGILVELAAMTPGTVARTFWTIAGLQRLSARRPTGRAICLDLGGATSRLAVDHRGARTG